VSAGAPEALWARALRRAWRTPLPELGAKVAHRVADVAGTAAQRAAWPLWREPALRSRAEEALWGGGEPLRQRLEALRRMAAPALFLDAGTRREGWLARFAADAGRRARVVADADRVLAREFDLLGSGPVCLPARLPWHADFKAAHRWPLRFHRAQRVYDHRDASDVKVPWELSRFQHLPVLGKAYWITGDERYAADAAGQLRDWLGENPVGYGVNWKCAMDVAIRAVNWVHAFAMFGGSPSFSDEDWKALLTGLFRHGQFIRGNLEYNPRRRGNHYLSDVVGLAFLGRFFGGTEEGREWAAFAAREVAGEMLHQVLADGVDHEMSTAYHGLVLELFAWGAAVLVRGEDGGAGVLDAVRARFGGEFAARLRLMFEYAEHFTRPDGRIPLFGDHDDGRLHLLGRYRGWEKDSARHLLGFGAALFGEPAWEAASDDDGREEGWWLTGGATPSSDGQVGATEPASRGFAESGFYVMRRGGSFLMVRCGPVGVKGGGGHDHCDHLSVEVALRGVPLVVDPGCYVYTADPAARTLFRGTAYHNTVQVDGAEQNEFDGYNLFALAERTRSRVLRWDAGGEVERFEGEHSGFSVVQAGLVHRRAIEHRVAEETFIVTDHLNGSGEHEHAWHWHLDPAVEVLGTERVERTVAGRTFREAVRLRAGQGDFVLACTLEGATVQQGWVSRSYGTRVPAPVLRWVRRAAGAVEESALIAPADVWRA
jgi:hypothetical protein